MDWNIVEGKWKELKGQAREQWGKLTDEELEEIGGKKDRLVGKLQQKYGYASDEAHGRVDEWAKQLDAKRQYEAAKTSVLSWWEHRSWIIIVVAIVLLLGVFFLGRARRTWARAISVSLCTMRQGGAHRLAKRYLTPDGSLRKEW